MLFKLYIKQFIFRQYKGIEVLTLNTEYDTVILVLLHLEGKQCAYITP